MEDSQPITMIGTTNADDQTQKTHEFERPGTITGALVGTSVGQQYALQNYAYLVRDGHKTNLWSALDKEFLAGNGRDYDFSLRFEFEKEDKLVLRAENVNTSGNQYHHALLIRVDYDRRAVLSKILGGI